MSSYEIGIEVKKLVDQILQEMAIKNDFDKSVVEVISRPVKSESITPLFRTFLKAPIKEEK